jgi:Pyruvate/2-oxoacid:ferredoxin oxidoreductase delta subunit
VPISDSVDRALALLKYLTLVLILVVTWQAGELFFRGYCPAYALLSRHGADITLWAYVIAGGMAIASLVITMPFCRWFCPLAAVLNPWARFGLMRVQRDVGACRECGRCTAICPMAIPVDRVKQVTASRCLSCLRCLEACPSRPAGALSWGLPGQAGQGRPGVIIPAVLFLCLGAAVAAAYLVPWPSFIKSRGTPPGDTAEVRLRIQGLTCRGRANLLVGFLERDDWYGIPGPAAGVPGYFKFEAWPDPVIAEVRIRFDPRLTNEETIKRAIIEPFYDAAKDQLWTSPFMIEGYDPLDLDRDESAESKSG